MLAEILEKILDQLKEEGCIIDDAAGYRAEEIIRQYMDGGKNGWISAEEQPKESGYLRRRHFWNICMTILRMKNIISIALKKCAKS